MKYYFHGGIAGLKTGASILPLSVSGNTHGRARWEALKPENRFRIDKAYITTDPRWALIFAAYHGDMAGRGCVYYVIPSGDMEADPDYIGTDRASFMVSFASVTGRLWILSKSRCRRILALIGQNLSAEELQLALGSAAEDR